MSNRFCSLIRISGDKWLICLSALLLEWSLPAVADVYPARIFSATQAVAAVTSGDFDPIHPGNELACLMADGSVVELALSATGWTANRSFRYQGSPVGSWDPTMRATLNVGDVLPQHAGQELLLSFQQQVVRLAKGGFGSGQPGE
jgi:hypothetical protein